MPGNVAQLIADIDAAFDVTHGATSQRGSIAAGIGNAISNYLLTVEVTGTTKAVGQPCTAGGPHPVVEIEGSLE